MKQPLLKSAFLFIIIWCGTALCSMAQDKEREETDKLLKESTRLQKSDQSTSYQLAIQALELASKISYKKAMATANIRIGSIVYTNGACDSAKTIIYRALHLYDEEKYAHGKAGAYLLLSYIYQDMGMKDSAFAALYESLKYVNQTDDTPLKLQIQIGLGNLHLDYGNKKEAFDNYTQAEKLAIETNKTDIITSAWDGLGRYYLTLPDANNALHYFMKVDSSARQVKDVYSVAQNLTNIALCYEMLKDYPHARDKYLEALHACEALDMQSGMALGEYNLGNIYLLMLETDNAIIHLERAITLARETNDPERLARTYQALAETYAMKGNHKKAFEYERAYTALNDSIMNKEKISQIAEMQTRYDTEKKIQTIQLLEAQGKAKLAQRNIFIVGTVLFLLLAAAIGIGLVKTRREKHISEELLLNILPSEVADELKSKGSAEAQFFDEVTVLFTDFKDFTQITEKLTPAELVDLLHFCFKSFDIIITKHHVEKIKTIGDSYMCAGGLPVPHKSTPQDVVNAALEIQEFMENLKHERIKMGKEPIEMRLGIHTGPVVAGIVGVKKFAYDIWGDTVNTASRMESSGVAGRVNISASTYEIVKDDFACTSRGFVEAKHKGLIEMYFVDGKIEK